MFVVCWRFRRAPSGLPPKVHSAVVHFRFRPPAVALADQSSVRGDGALDIHAATKDPAERPGAFRRFASPSTRAPRWRSVGIDPRRRPETLQLTELARLADYFVSPEGRAVL